MGLICGVDGKDWGLGIKRGEGCEWKGKRGGMGAWAWARLFRREEHSRSTTGL